MATMRRHMLFRQPKGKYPARSRQVFSQPLAMPVALSYNPLLFFAKVIMRIVTGLSWEFFDGQSLAGHLYIWDKDILILKR